MNVEKSLTKLIEEAKERIEQLKKSQELRTEGRPGDWRYERECGKLIELNKWYYELISVEQSVDKNEENEYPQDDFIDKHMLKIMDKIIDGLIHVHIEKNAWQCRSGKRTAFC